MFISENLINLILLQVAMEYINQENQYVVSWECF